MNKINKVCLYCGKAFEAKRSTAVYCSENCRVKAHQNKNRAKNRNESIEKINHTVRIAGKMKLPEIIKTITDSENKIERLKNQMQVLKDENKELNKKLFSLKTNLRNIKTEQLGKLQVILDLSDEKLFNSFLNQDYKKAQAKKDAFANYKLVSKYDIDRNKSHQNEINLYRIKLNFKKAKYENELEAINLQIIQIQNLIEKNTEQIKEHLQDIRFYQSRILKYDAFLSGV